MNKQMYKILSEMIEKETGIVYGESDYDRLKFRVEKLKELLQVGSDEELVRKFQNSPGSDLQSLLVSTSTNNETSFFRDRKPFEILTSFILPEIFKTKTTRSIKLWCVATSTGQEPYSIAMKVKDSPDLKDVYFEIKASDIDDEVLKKAKAGLYQQPEIQRGLPIQYLTKYFNQKEATSWEIKTEVKALIHFFHFNLISGFYPSAEYDVIFCRNVLIYQSMENKTKVVNGLFQALKPGGFLVLGGSENLIGIKSGFKMVQVGELMIFQKPL